MPRLCPDSDDIGKLRGTKVIGFHPKRLVHPSFETQFEDVGKCSKSCRSRADLFVPRYCDCHRFVMDLRKHSTFSHRGELGRNAVLSDHVEQCEIVLFGAR